MFNRKKIISIVLLIGLAIILLWENKKLSSSLDTVEIDSTFKKETEKSIADSVNSADSNSVTTSPTEESAGSQTKNTPLEFADWLRSEAQLLDKNDPNNLDKENTLKLKALQFTANEIQYLKKMATDTSATANERITAVYFLTIASEMALSSLFDIAEAPYSLPSPQPVHSLGESTLMQEKAIRVVAIDELFNRFQNNAITRSELENGIQRISDPGLKQYATNRLLELK